MSEELQVIDNQGELIEYLRRANITKQQEVVYDYNFLPEFYKENIGQEWDNIVDTTRHYIGMLGKDTTPYSVFLQGYPYNHISIADLRNNHIKQVVVVDGLVRKISEAKEQMTSSAWACTCSPTRIVRSQGLHKPEKCEICGGTKKFELVTEDCIYQDVQTITLQELNPGARQPKSIKCKLTGSLIDTLQAGNRCTITGLVRVEVDRDYIGTLWLDVLYCERPDEEYIDVDITPEDEARIKELASRPSVYRELCESINPAIWGYNEVKLALILQMFGGVTAEESKTNAERVRGDSHILICGDPSMAKSQLIRSIAKIVPRCIYTSGKSTSAAGLTVAAVRDEGTGQWTLEAGALVLANGAFCVIDELDKMSPDDRSALHEAMESQSISVAKAGINQTLQTACPMLCAANPKFGRFLEGIPEIEQINLPPALMSRFDLIFMLRDIPSRDNDRLVAQRVLQNTDTVLDSGLQRPVDVDLLRKYIIYAKRINPRLPESVKDLLEEKYISIRQEPDSTITVRQLHALIRLTQSSARVGLRSVCEIEDVNRAIELFNFAMNSVTLGKGIDVSVFDSKCSKREINKMETVITIVRENEGDDLITMSERASQDYGISPEEFNNIMVELTMKRIIHMESGKYVISE